MYALRSCFLSFCRYFKLIALQSYQFYFYSSLSDLYLSEDVMKRTKKVYN